MVSKKKSFALEYAKKFLNKKGFELFKKNNQTKTDNSFKSFAYTAFFGFTMIVFFF